MKEIPYELIARYFAGACSEDEKQWLQEWSLQHPEIMEQLAKIWEEDAVQTFEPDVEGALQKVHSHIDAKKGIQPKRLFSLLIGLAAAVLVLIGIAGIWNWNQSGQQTSDSLFVTETTTDVTREFVLPDGSKVWLNNSSSIRFPENFTHQLREVYLEGEAFFDISPDAERPFVIHANHTLTQVVGTSFGVRAVKGESEVVVTVTTGIVQFSAEGKKDQLTLNQGEQAACDPKREKLEKNENPNPNLLAWKTRLLVFKQTPLVEVGRVIQDVYHTPIAIDDSIKELQLTSTFDQLSLEEVVEIIEMTLQIQAQKQGDTFLLTN